MQQKKPLLVHKTWEIKQITNMVAKVRIEAPKI